MTKKYVSNEIGDEYKKWTPGELVTITAPTGSGKTYFILHTLLGFAIANRRRILYLVNRKALKWQIEEEIELISRSYIKLGFVNLKDYICVKTYQHLEREIKNETADFRKYDLELERRNKKIMELSDYKFDDSKDKYYELLHQENEVRYLTNQFLDDRKHKVNEYYYIVADESHYFLADALFNTNTCLSYNWIREMQSYAVVVMISATLDGIVQLNALGEYPTVDSKIHSLCYNFLRKQYEVPRDYSYLELYAIDSMEDIPELLEKQKGNDKWLIFWNDINKGKDLERVLQKRNIKAIFIDSTYEESETTKNSVEKIAKEKILAHDVVISTATLDNGISIHDDSLRNIIIMADTKEEFIQMLGRKRTDGQKVNLYMCRRSKGDFSKRKSYADRCMKVYEICKEMIGYPELEIDTYTRRMKQAVLAERLLGDHMFYLEARKFLYVEYYGESNDNWLPFYRISLMSIIQLVKQIEIYEQQIKRFEKEGPDAFLRTQLEWLDIQDIDEELERLSMSEELKIRERICNVLDEYLKHKITKEKNCELRLKIGPDLRKLYELCYSPVEQTEDMKKKQASIAKNDDRQLTVKVFLKYMEILDLPYEMEKSEGDYFIYKKE